MKHAIAILLSLIYIPIGFSPEKFQKNPSEIILKPRNSDFNQITLSQTGNEWIVTTLGNDPYFFIETTQPVDIKIHYILSFESFNTAESLPLVIFVGNKLDGQHLIDKVYSIPRTEGWTTNSFDISITMEPPEGIFNSLRIRFGNTSGKNFRLRNFRLREPTPAEKELSEKREELSRRDQQLTIRLRNYLDQEFDSEITSVQANYHTNEISIRGSVTHTDLTDIGIMEIPIWSDITNPENTGMYISISSKDFTIQVDRKSEKYDRLLSGWAIVRKEKNDTYELLSPLHYVDDIKPRSRLKKMIPRSLKGIGGCPFDHPDMQELGIASVTFNILLDRILFAENAPGRIPYMYAGRTWYADIEGHHIRMIDKDVKIASENQWMVSAILLIPVNRSGDRNTWLGKAAHPEAETSAAFAMPAMNSEEGVMAYAATMNFLAERYSTPQYGRIHHWIIHNEIQNGFYWTNAGKKSIETYMNLYQKSMRMVQLIARQYDPNAKALISLDHDWNVTGDIRGYKGKELLELLLKFSRKEGDFEWGIAQHPYPQDINNPRTWEDPKADGSYDTPYLTPKNLEVLDNWVEQKHVLFRGNPREIQFTEQGINSPDYSEKSLIDQAAGMVYTWEKLKGLKNVTAYQYHLWADAHEEGGLKLGLRKYHNAEGDPLGKKPIWYLYQAADTEKWEPLSNKYKAVIGI